MPRKTTWTNQDGLIIGNGPHTSDDAVPAINAGRGALRTIQTRIGYADLVSAGASWTATDGSPNAVVIPRGSRIVRATFAVKTSFATLTALVIGTWGIKDRQYDITAAVDDADGIMTTTEGAAANLAAGNIVNCNGALIALSSNVGILVGATSNSNCVLQYVYTGSAPTAGDGVLTVEYYTPPFVASIEV